MKFSFFHFMPYPYIPDDFDQSFNSSSLTFPNKYFDPQQGHKLYHRYLDELEYAEKAGFDGIAVNEHHQTFYGLMPSPNIMAAALARRTSKATIMILGNAIAIRDHPLRVAEEIAMLDHLTDGRLVSGFVRAIGWEYFSHSINPVHSRERFVEAHDLIVKAWTSEEMFEWISPHYHFRYVNLWPRPLQVPHPPVFIAGGGSTETMRFCAEHRYTYMAVYAPVPTVKLWFDGYRAAAAELGYTPGPEKLVYSLPIYVAETDEIAHAEAREHVWWLFNRATKTPSQYNAPPGYMSLNSLRGLLQIGRAGVSKGGWGNFAYEDILAAGLAVVGSPATVGERLVELANELGFGTLMSILAIGDMPHHRTIKNIDLFTSEVMPVLRPYNGT
jgi:alkanesulfonate monooxygenase SsuD/methylene tetrahydromethanopterin reductase-like flavin-dependent oxidoreductase (luciferase family)